MPFALFALALSLPLAFAPAIAPADCDAKTREELAYLTSPEIQKDVDLLAVFLTLPGSAPGSAKQKEEKLFCFNIRKEWGNYTALAAKLKEHVRLATAERLQVYPAFGNSALNLTSLKEGYCDNPKCDGGWLEDKRCGQASVAGQLKALQDDVPQIRAMRDRVAAEKKACGMTAAHDQPDPQKIMATTPLQPSSPDSPQVQGRTRNPRASEASKASDAPAPASVGEGR
jgi:hypothetical protein